MKQKLEQFDAWLKQPWLPGIPNAVPVVAALLYLGTYAILTIILCK